MPPAPLRGDAYEARTLALEASATVVEAVDRLEKAGFPVAYHTLQAWANRNGITPGQHERAKSRLLIAEGCVTDLKLLADHFRESPATPIQASLFAGMVIGRLQQWEAEVTKLSKSHDG